MKIIKFAASQQIPSGLSEIHQKQKGQFWGYKAKKSETTSKMAWNWPMRIKNFIKGLIIHVNIHQTVILDF